MPVVREHLSVSQFAELVGIDPARFNGVEVDKRSSRVTLVLEPCEHVWEKRLRGDFGTGEINALIQCSGCGLRAAESTEFVEEFKMAQPSGAFPQLNTGGKTVSGKKGKGGRKGC